MGGLFSQASAELEWIRTAKGDPAVIDSWTKTDKNERILIAARCSHFDVVQALLARGADAAAKDPEGFTVLHNLAVARGTMQELHSIMRLALEKGGSINAASKDGNTPLHSAAAVGRIEPVRALLALGAKIDLLNEDSQTPLDCAKEEWFADVIAVLEGARDEQGGEYI